MVLVRAAVASIATGAYLYSQRKTGNASELVLHAPHQPWTHKESIFQGFDMFSVRRGCTVWQEVMASCHSLKHVSFRHLEISEGGALLPEEVKQIASEFQVIPVDPDDEGDYPMRDGKPTDMIPNPYKNANHARAANAGAVPPDLTQIVYAREQHEDYIFALLTGYDREIPAGVTQGQGQYYNPYFPGGLIAMPPPLHDGMLENIDGAPATRSQMAKDVTNFLANVGRPWLHESKTLALKSLATMGLSFFLVTYWTKLRWSVVKTKRTSFRDRL